MSRFDRQACKVCFNDLYIGRTGAGTQRSTGSYSFSRRSPSVRPCGLEGRAQDSDRGHRDYRVFATVTRVSAVAAKVAEAEDIVFEATVNTLRKAGFDLFDRLDFVATWAWTWAEEGKIEFNLKENMAMEAKLFPNGNNLTHNLLDWGDGDWELNNGRLQITMRRVGKVGVPPAHKRTQGKVDRRRSSFCQ